MEFNRFRDLSAVNASPIRPLNSVLIEGEVASKPKINDDGSVAFVLKSDGVMVDVHASAFYQGIMQGHLILVIGKIFGTRVAIKALHIEEVVNENQEN